MAQIEAWLLDVNGRLLTIVGVGGMGKTRLAQEAARAQIGSFANGVWAISLVAYTHFSEVVTAVSETIGLTLTGKEDPAQQLVKHLQNQEMLLVLDNLEHLLTSELLDMVTQLTANAPDLRLIITSRERLHLQAETLLDLHGLPFPEGTQSPISTYPAIQLFTNRAQRVQADFSLDKQETAVAQLCQLVGGLPLALELAATWTRVLTVSEIVTEIQRGLDTLTTSLHDIPERHRSLRAVITTSWQMLSSDEQRLFRQLAVFRGGFTRAAAEQVAGATMTQLQLMSLADRSFLRLDGDHRFRRHPLLLQFAQEQLAAYPEEKTQTEAAHAHFFAEFAQARKITLQGADAPEALTELGAELENLRVAWQWGLAVLDTAVLDNLLPVISRFFSDRSRYREGIALFEDSLAHIQTQPITPEHEQIVAKIQAELGYFLHQIGHYAEAETAYQAGQTLALKYNLVKTQISCLRGFGIIANSQGHWERSRQFTEEAYALCQTDGDVELKLPILNTLGTVYTDLGDFDQAVAYFEEAMVLAESLGHVLRVAFLYSNIGIIANRQKNYQEAIRQWRLAEQGFVASNHDLGLANTIFNIAMALHGLEQYEEALATIERASALHEKTGQQQSLAAGLGVRGMIYHKMGKRAAARRHLHECLLMSHELGMAGTAVYSLTEIAEMEVSGGNFEQAAFLLNFIRNHPSASGTTKQNVENLLQELTAELPPELMSQAETAAQSYTLDSLIAELTRK